MSSEVGYCVQLEGQLCEVCADLQDLDISTIGACGTIYINATCLGETEEWDLGVVRSIGPYFLTLIV